MNLSRLYKFGASEFSARLLRSAWNQLHPFYKIFKKVSKTLDNTYDTCYALFKEKREQTHEIREIEKIIKKDGWKYSYTSGSHHYYIHPTKPGKVTIPYHGSKA